MDIKTNLISLILTFKVKINHQLFKIKIKQDLTGLRMKSFLKFNETLLFHQPDNLLITDGKICYPFFCFLVNLSYFMLEVHNDYLQ